jgi:hypothetical protein
MNLVGKCEGRRKKTQSWIENNIKNDLQEMGWEGLD